MTAVAGVAGRCRYCTCTEADPCKLPDGDPCNWRDVTRTVCTAPACLNAYYIDKGRAADAAAKQSRKRSPGTIHQLMLEERRAKRRKQRAAAKKRGIA